MNSPLNAEQWRSIQVQFEGQRLRLGWTREELARRSGISRTTLFYLERGGTQQPRLSTLKRLAKTLELDFQALIGESLTGPFGTASPLDHSNSSHPYPEIPMGRNSEPLSDSSRFDRETNPSITDVVAESPTLFQGFSHSDWDELYSCMGMGGPLTHDGVRHQAARISRKKQLIRKLEVLLETHYSEVAATLLDALFEKIRFPSPNEEGNAGWQAPDRSHPPGGS